MLHLGGEYSVPMRHVIMILDYQKALDNKDTSLFLKRLKEEADWISIDGTSKKSAILTEFLGKKTLYLSPISSTTLARRSKAGQHLNS